MHVIYLGGDSWKHMRKWGSALGWRQVIKGVLMSSHHCSYLGLSLREACKRRWGPTSGLSTTGTGAGVRVHHCCPQQPPLPLALPLPRAPRPEPTPVVRGFLCRWTEVLEVGREECIQTLPKRSVPSWPGQR